MKLVTLCAAACVVLVVAAALAQTARAETLLNQIDLTSPQSTPSQNFEPMFDTSDSLTVDDFTVPAGETWKLDSALIRGANFGMSTTSTVSVSVFADGGGTPGAAVFSGQLTAADYPNFTIPLATVPVLAAGTYWLGVQAELNGVNPDPMLRQQWFWRENDEGSLGNAAMFRNPGGAISPACPAFAVRSTCIAGHTGHDQSFLLNGTRTILPGPPPPSDTTAPSTSVAKTPKTLRLKGSARSALVKFRFGSSEAGSKFVCKLDAARFKACKSPLSARLKPGKHTLKVKATDAAGNTDTSPAKVSVTVLKAKPVRNP